MIQEEERSVMANKGKDLEQRYRHPLKALSGDLSGDNKDNYEKIMIPGRESIPELSNTKQEY
jgi:hypothetical protein